MGEGIQEKRQSEFRYSNLQRIGIELYRKFVPSVNSRYTEGHVEDIASVHLASPEKMQESFGVYLQKLRALRGGDDIGDYLEFGVFNGTSLASMHAATRKRGIKNMRMFGFDAFEGLPPGAENEDGGVFKAGFYTCSFEQLQDCLKQKGVRGDAVTFVKGWYEETLNQETADKYNFNPGIIFIDCDTYSSSKTVLDFVAPLIKKPTIVCLDDWRLYDLDIKGEGEYKSFNEFLENNPHLRVEEIESYKRNARVFLVQPFQSKVEVK